MTKDRVDARKEARKVERLEAFSMMELSSNKQAFLEVYSYIGPLYRSMMVMSGATRREA